MLTNDKKKTAPTPTTQKDQILSQKLKDNINKNSTMNNRS